METFIRKKVGLVNIAVDHICMELYLLQSVKSVIAEVLEEAKQAATTDEPVTMTGEPLPVVDENMHMGIMRSGDGCQREHQEDPKNNIWSHGGWTAWREWVGPRDIDAANTNICSSCSWVGGGVALKNSYRQAGATLQDVSKTSSVSA